MELCLNCDKFAKCKKLCAEAEKYVSQDNVVQTEFMINKRDNSTLENYYDYDYCWNRVNIEGRGRVKNLIIQMTEDGKSASEIAYHLPCSDSYIRRVRRRYLKKNKKEK